ncbi:type 1 glutamine amidotransferase domain-containing protein [Alteromonas sp. ASW11-36]|uniref:Type 1 glutamine amidotransferase domain-containing protein n=1 Tax=Alteromonas arenosi TaxID=3055817 RepID=A0ABT7SW94_9ALTE|nr:type 1 glutamine amidotransferase domain-containing protein [Alteromonas sp. ASW11-36]MDM7860415.1 type 1 glutamine amidotransferase domain-containing protein [Alteromonas sp. ASW11-36]
MRHFITRVLALVTLLSASFTQVYATTNTQQDTTVLMVVSGYGQSQGEEQPGYEFDEFAKAYLVFKAHNLAVDVASPHGGAVEADQYDPNKAFNAQVLADSAIMTKLNNTLAISSLDANDYDAVFVVGGKGAMFDLPKDTALQQIIADVYEQQGVIAAVCHGPAALVDVELSNGEYLVAGKRINGFTNDEEQLFGKKWLPHFEFLLEDKLTERGGVFQSSDIMLEHVAVDDRLVTGQNPSSTVGVATAMLEAMGIAVQPVERFSDDLTLAQVAEFLSGDEKALEQLSTDPERYHLALAGMYGFYYLKQAEDEKQQQQALALMLVAQEAINNPNLDIQIAKTQQLLGDTIASQKTAEKILAQHPDFEPAQQLLASLKQ